jgi:hypothetical protein
MAKFIVFLCYAALKTKKAEEYEILQLFILLYIMLKIVVISK